MKQATTFAQTLQVQFNFQFVETQRLLTLARSLPAAQYYHKVDPGLASIHDLFIHLLGAAMFWRCTIAQQPIIDHTPAAVADIDALLVSFAKEGDAWLELLDTFETTTLLTAQRPSPFGHADFILWVTIQHVILHGMQHLGEIAHLLTTAGQSPGDIDFYDYQFNQ